MPLEPPFAPRQCDCVVHQRVYWHVGGGLPLRVRRVAFAGPGRIPE